MKRALLAVVVVAALLLPASALARVGTGRAPAGAVANYRAPVAATPLFQLTEKEQLVISLINKQRAKHGLHAVRANLSLVEAARDHSAEMVGKQYFSHESYSGESFWQRLIRYGYKRSGYTSWTVGEDIAWGQGLLGSPQAIVDAWMHSAPHRQVILTPKFRDCGVGVASGSYKSGAFLFTLDMGQRRK